MSMRSIYRKVAKEYGVTVAEVKRDMQEAITHATRTPRMMASPLPIRIGCRTKEKSPPPMS